jgi:hypothetical protein
MKPSHTATIHPQMRISGMRQAKTAAIKNTSQIMSAHSGFAMCWQYSHWSS